MAASTVLQPESRCAMGFPSDPIVQLLDIINECRATRGLPSLSRLEWAVRTAPQERQA
jgi:hypothetical protein